MTWAPGAWGWGLCPVAYSGKLVHCPLYAESHRGRGLGCVDDLAKPCMVERGAMDHRAALRTITRAGDVDPNLLWSIDVEGLG